MGNLRFGNMGPELVLIYLGAPFEVIVCLDQVVPSFGDAGLPLSFS
jgi:hypothetical protein